MMNVHNINFSKLLIKNVYRLNIFFLLSPIKVFAAEEKMSTIISTDPMSGSYLFQLILGLIVVLICIVALAWFAKRMNRLQSSTGGMLKIIGGISMGSRERIVLLQVGSEQLLVGVSPGRINTLHVLEAPLDNVDVNSEKTFATNLAEAVLQKNSASYRQKTNDA
jgi:flagellar protein FliO/FliZ